MSTQKKHPILNAIDTVGRALTFGVMPEIKERKWIEPPPLPSLPKVKNTLSQKKKHSDKKPAYSK